MTTDIAHNLEQVRSQISEAAKNPDDRRMKFN